MSVSAKICGLTRPGDAALAVRHGAWRLGVIFAGGPRLIDIAGARAIVDAAGGVPVLGVFGTAPIRTILETVRSAGLAGAQLHGGADAGATALLEAEGLEVWQVARFSTAAALDAEHARIGRSGTRVLIEPASPGGGGQGIELPVDLAVAARQRFADRQMVLAGGLRSDTVAAAIRVVGPDAVDVSSGVESGPGLKDPARLVAFLEAVRDARPAA